MNIMLFKFLLMIKKGFKVIIKGINWLVAEIIKAFLKILITVVILVGIYYFFLREFLNLSLFL